MRRLGVVLLIVSLMAQSHAQIPGMISPGGFVPPPGSNYMPGSTGNFIPGPSITPSPIGGAINSTIGSVTPGQISNSLNSGIPIKKPWAGGAKILSKGNVLIAMGVAIPAAMGWFYQQAQDAANPGPLDEWSGTGVGRLMEARASAWVVPKTSTEPAKWRITYGGIASTRPNGSGQAVGGDEYLPYSSTAPDIKPYLQRAKDLVTGKHLEIRTGTWKWYWVDHAEGNTSVANVKSQQTLLDAMKNDPALQEDFGGRVWPAFVNNGPKASNGLPAGVTIEAPAPNANQVQDNPDADPDLDSDGDGWTDTAEAGLGHLPIDPYQPFEIPPPSYDPNYDYDDDGYSDGLENDEGTPVNNPDEHPPGPPDRPLEPWEEDPRIQEEPPTDPTPGDDITPSEGDADGDGVPDEEDDFVTPVVDPTPGDDVWPSPGDENGDGQPDEGDGGTDPQPGVDPTPGDDIAPSEGDADGDGVEDSEDDFVTPVVDPTPGDGTWPSPGDSDGDGLNDITGDPVVPGEDPKENEEPGDGTGEEPAPDTDPTPGDGITPTPGDSDGDGVPDPQDPYVTPPDPTPGDGIVPTPGDGNGDGVPDAPGEDDGPIPVDEPGEDTGPEPEQQPPPEEPGVEPSPMDPGAQEPRYPLQLPIPTLTFPTEPFIQWQDRAQQKMSQWVDQSKTKFPFGLGTWIPVIPGTGGLGACTPVKMTLLGIEQDVGICNTPIDTFMASAGRAALLLLACVAFYFASAKVMSAS